MLLVLSLGQTTVERGFSMNKQVETDDLYKKSIVAKRTICDYVAYVGGIKRAKNWYWQQLLRNILITSMSLINRRQLTNSL